MPGSEDAIAEAPPSGGRRERRRREIRDRLFDTAIELFLEQGYERTTMEEIGERADVARTTVFNHYPRKAEFLVEWAARRRDTVESKLRRGHLSHEPIALILEHYMQLMADLNHDHRAETKELMSAAIAHNRSLLINPPLSRALAGYIRRAQKRGEVCAEISPDQAGLMLATAYFATLISWIDAEPAPFDLHAELGNAVSIVLHGISASS